MLKVVAKSFVYDDKVDEVLKLYEELVSETQKEQVVYHTTYIRILTTEQYESC